MTIGPRRIIIENAGIVGVLQEKGVDKRLVLIAHGAGGNKEQLFLPRLADSLAYSTFRFDFRGNGESQGEPKYASLEDNHGDLHTVASYFESQGYAIYAVIGHSRGAIAAVKFASTCLTPLAHVVNIAGRYKMDDPDRISQDKKKDLAEKGYFDWPVDHQGQIKQVKVTQTDLEAFAAWDNSHVARIPRATCVLTIHGLQDMIVPPENAALFANQVPNHVLALVPGADHIFTDKVNELVSLIVKHMSDYDTSPLTKARAMGLDQAVCIPRWIDVDGVKNFRDIGGWPTQDGYYVRQRMIFRCGHLGGITPLGIETLKHLGVSTVYDLRSDIERNKPKRGIPDIPGITFHKVPVFDDEAFSPLKMKENLSIFLNGPDGFFNGYKVILEKAAPRYRRIFLDILAHDSQSFLVHCQVGKDRTGLFFLLLLGLCGVPDEIITHEYTLTTLGIWEPSATLAAMAKLSQASVENVTAAVSAPLTIIQLTLEFLKQEYGSVEGYITRKCGLSNEQCQALRDTLVVPIRFEQRQLYRYGTQ